MIKSGGGPLPRRGQAASFRALTAGCGLRGVRSRVFCAGTYREAELVEVFRLAIPGSAISFSMSATSTGTNDDRFS